MKSILVGLFFCCAQLGLAQLSCNTERRYIDPIFPTIQVTTGILYGSADPFNPFVSNQNLYLDFYEPQGDTAAFRPLIIHAFGGGFLNGTRTSDDIPYWAQEYVKKGYVFASIDYRLGFNPLDGGSIERAAYRCAQDYSAALRFLADNANLYRIDLNNVIVTGNSAGSIGGLIVAFMRDADRPASTFGTTLESGDLGCFSCSGNSNYNNQKVPVKACVNLWGAVLDTTFIDLSNDSTDLIPTISFHGDADAVVPYQSGNPYSLPFFPTVYGSQSIHIRMDNEAIPNEFVSFPGFPHEPEQDYPWVSDTIVSKASKFLYPFIYGDSAQINCDQQICIDSLVMIAASPHAGSNYCWNIPNATIVNENGNTIQVHFDSVGFYPVYVTETDYKGLSKMDSLVIEVQTPPQSGFTYSGQDGLLQLSLTNNTISQANWEFGDGMSSSLLNPTHQYIDTGLFQVHVQMTNNYCSADTSYPLIANKCPEAGYSYELIDSTLFIYNESSLANDLFWVDFEGTVFTGDTFSYSLTSEADFAFVLNVSNQYCSDEINELLDINFCAVADLSYQINGLNVSFQDASYKAFFYAWDFGDGAISALPNPIHSYEQPGIYAVSLVVTSLEACSDTLVMELEVNELNTAIIDVLTPLKVFPNPSSGIINIAGLNQLEGMQLKLSNSLGQVIYLGEAKPSQAILEGLNTGLYFLQISNENASRVITILKE